MVTPVISTSLHTGDQLPMKFEIVEMVGDWERWFDLLGKCYLWACEGEVREG
jgi:hypothetical protein